MAFIMKTDCVAQAGGGKQPFPTTASPALAKVTIGGKSCAAGSSGSGAF